MITIKKYRLGEEPEVDKEMLLLSDSQRFDLLTQLIEMSWQFAHNEPFPKMDRSIVKYYIAPWCKKTTAEKSL